MKACQNSAKRNFDDPLTELLHLHRGVQTAMQTCDEETRKDEEAVRTVDWIAVGFGAFVTGLLVAWAIFRML